VRVSEVVVNFLTPYLFALCEKQFRPRKSSRNYLSRRSPRYSGHKGVKG
jgi:hypothetical protein